MNISTLTNVSLMLCLTLLFIFALAFLLKHFKKIIPQIPGALQVLGGANLGNKSKVVLIEAYHAKILVGVTDSQIQTLYVFTNEQSNPKEQLK
ncbi:MAG: FliO/MopB family protein [Gammaproteobacteria bacterium]|nr:FliO/MopB family protein [Gammaproteobacteria bacterium]